MGTLLADDAYISVKEEHMEMPIIFVGAVMVLCRCCNGAVGVEVKATKHLSLLQDLLGITRICFRLSGCLFASKGLIPIA